ncbi:hypothetical protein QKW35_15790 [Pontibacterium granulatum]|uniref:hypothetical protein n=1 Tax=Pontibacterium granulatum TaxID=2036029 RepID=UPI00249C97C1|nr:hypothetical protein [Pontibacterium granulatum]MDI3325842.1 hypothetical protein [Pontibacterium granulatum]
MEKPADLASLWGTFELDTSQTIRWHLGPLDLSIQRFAHEWQIRTQSKNIEPDAEIPFHVEPDALPLGDESHLDRCVCCTTSNGVRVLPALADRPIVARPSTTIHIPSGEHVSLYISSPVWVCIDVEALSDWLLELPILRPSDTWFGPSTREGEMCYAARTAARLCKEDIPKRSHRAVTPLTIHNKGDKTLILERLKLPVPYLSLFFSADGWLWTEDVTIVCKQDMESAEILIGTGAPACSEHAPLLREPRVRVDTGILVRTLGTIFG